MPARHGYVVAEPVFIASPSAAGAIRFAEHLVVADMAGALLHQRFGYRAAVEQYAFVGLRAIIIIPVEAGCRSMRREGKHVHCDRVADVHLARGDRIKQRRTRPDCPDIRPLHAADDPADRRKIQKLLLGMWAFGDRPRGKTTYTAGHADGIHSITESLPQNASRRCAKSMRPISSDTPARVSARPHPLARRSHHSRR